MLPQKLIKTVSFILIVLYLASCSTTYEVTKRSELIVPDDLGELTVLTKDNKLYMMEHYVLNESVLTYTGSVTINNSTKPSSGKVNLSDIKQINASNSSVGKTVLITGAGAAILITFLVFMNKQKDMKNEVVIKYPAGGGCSASSNQKIYERIPMAAGLNNLLEAKISKSSFEFYLQVIDISGDYYFKVREDANLVRIDYINCGSYNIDDSEKMIVDFRFIW